MGSLLSLRANVTKQRNALLDGVTRLQLDPTKQLPDSLLRDRDCRNLYLRGGERPHRLALASITLHRLHLRRRLRHPRLPPLHRRGLLLRLLPDGYDLRTTGVVVLLDGGPHGARRAAPRHHHGIYELVRLCLRQLVAAHFLPRHRCPGLSQGLCRQPGHGRVHDPADRRHCVP